MFLFLFFQLRGKRISKSNDGMATVAMRFHPWLFGSSRAIHLLLYFSIAIASKWMRGGEDDPPASLEGTPEFSHSPTISSSSSYLYFKRRRRRGERTVARPTTLKTFYYTHKERRRTFFF
jgi:hypothetical protein